MKTIRTKTMKNALKTCALIAAACVACCFTGCIDDEDESENVIFFSIYNSDGTLGSSGMTSEEWETILWRLSDGCTIVFSSDMTSEDLATFASVLKHSGLSGVTLDMSKMTITYIASSTFSGCEAIRSVILPDSLVSIGESAFSGCSSLASVTIGENLATVGQNAFSGCTALALVTYDGTADEWDEISIASGNDYLTGATFVYSTTEDDDTGDDTSDGGEDDGTGGSTEDSATGEGSSGMSQSDWASILASYSDGDTITLSSSLTSSDLTVLSAALV